MGEMVGCVQGVVLDEEACESVPPKVSEMSSQSESCVTVHKAPFYDFHFSSTLTVFFFFFFF